MDAQAEHNIVRSHGHLVSHSSTPVSLTHLPPALLPTETSNTDDSGPPSPSTGPIINFAEVEPGLYRSSFPMAANMDHLQSLGLKTILTLVPREYPAEGVAFVEGNGIRHFCIPIPALKTPEQCIESDSVVDALRILLEPAYRPVLVHCNKGKHRTGCIIATYRLLRNWTLAATLTEYRHYAGAKYRPLDEKFISGVDVREMGSALGPKLLLIAGEGEDVKVEGGEEDRREVAISGAGRQQGPYPTPPCSDKDGAA